MTAGVFHYEQSMALMPYCQTALYFPYDENLSTEFDSGQERGLMTYRRQMTRVNIPKVRGWIHKRNVMRDLEWICKDFSPDIIHAHCALPAGNIVVEFGKRYGYPVVITEHSPMEHMPLDQKRGRAKIDYVYCNSNANVCVSIDSMNRLMEYFPDYPFQVIYNGILSPETVGVDGCRYRVEGKINCCIVAAFYSKDIKGYQYLIPAIAQLRQEGLPIVLHICGGGDYFDYYVNMAKELGIEESCIFYGNCSKKKVYSIVSQMDFNISASLYESAGVSIEEALLLGKPMLVTRSGGANSLVNEDVAIVVDKGSTQALVSGIREMAGKLDEFDPAVIREYAFGNFEIDQVSRQYVALYEKLLEERK